MSALGVQLGSFELLDLLGQGGMGRVYRGRHRAQGVPVAVKVLSALRARDAQFHKAFAAEVEVIAGLDHPGVILVFDHGLVPAAAADASGGELLEGSPYLVMELATGGSLMDETTTCAWSETRSVLLGMLDALAHAHAHGVIHRDVKRGNILVATEGDLRPGLKLSDFGLAHHPGDARTGLREENLSGTPAYMAPEQCAGRWRDYGPWTDLYALGCVGWALTTGTVPFHGLRLRATLKAHVHDPPPPWRPSVPAPPGFEAWLLRALAKKPRHRFRCAADAAEALLELPEQIDGGDAPPAPMHPLVPETTAWALEVLTTQAQMRKAAADDLSGVFDLPTLTTRRRKGSAQLHRVPADWRRPEGGRSVQRLVGAGLGLCGIKRIPLVGQERLRDALWEALTETHEDDVPRPVLLSGTNGSGKTRVVDWLGRRAVELGLANRITATHSATPARTDGLGPAFRRYLRLEGLTREQCRPRVLKALRRRGIDSDYDCRALLQILAPASPDAADAIRFSGSNERFAVLARFLEADALDRPLLLVLEDAHRSPLAVTFARFLSKRRPLRALIVLTMTPDDPTQDDRPRGVTPESARTLLPHALHATVDPLPPAARRKLVEELLGLTPALARRVIDRTGGSPLFAVEIVSDWVRRDLLVPSARGYRLRDSRTTELPRGLHQLCAGRLRNALRASGPDALVAVELAAALGEAPSEDEWMATCSRAGLASGLVTVVPERLVGAGLAEFTTDGWRFSHGAVRESVERRCREEGHTADRHALCAEVLAEREAPPHRLGRHLLRAGRWEASFDLLLAGARSAATESDLALARALVDDAEAALQHLSPASPDRRVAELQGLRAELLQFEGRLEESGRMAARCLAAAERGGWGAIAADAAIRLGTVRLRGGEIGVSRKLFERAARLFEEQGNPSGSALALGFSARAAAFAGDVCEANEAADRSMQAANASGKPVARAQALLVRSELLRRTPDLPTARRLAEEAVCVLEAAGRHTALAEALSALAETVRGAGELALAEALYLRSQALWDELGSHEAVTVDVNLAILALLQGDDDRARRLLEATLDTSEAPGDRFLIYGARLLLLPALAAQNAWQAMETHLDFLDRLPAAERFVEPDLAWAAETATVTASKAGRAALAGRVAEIAIAQRLKLGDDDAMIRLREMLVGL